MLRDKTVWGALLMSEIFFDTLPPLEVLQWLAQGALRQNFLLAVRLWVWGRFFYGTEGRSPSDPFTYAQCRDLLLTATHPRDDTLPLGHDPDCLCAQTASQLLFQGARAAEVQQWRAIAQHHIEAEKLTQVLARRPFAVTRRSLAHDLKLLVQLGGLTAEGSTYRRVQTWPKVAIAPSSSTPAIDQLHPDLATIMHNLSLQTEDGARFFLHLDYVVPEAATDAVDQWHEHLREVWQDDPIPPIHLTYRSARARQTVTAVVYPVCAYYVRRAVYLCGFNPDLEHHWYNYRLDKIQDFTPLAWSDPTVPAALNAQHRNGSLPTPGYVEEQMSRAWGFDFYLPSQRLLLRFERKFHDAYIAGTVRHDTFTQITYEEAIAQIHQNATGHNVETLLTAMAQKSRHDAYYRAEYRSDLNTHDTNVQQRLRAWRPYLEVILPVSLRHIMAAEVATEYQIYTSS